MIEVLLKDGRSLFVPAGNEAERRGRKVYILDAQSQCVAIVLEKEIVGIHGS